MLIDEFDLFERAESTAPPPRQIRPREVWRHEDQDRLLVVVDAIPEPVRVSEAITRWEESVIVWEELVPVDAAAAASAPRAPRAGTATAVQWRDQCVHVADTILAFRNAELLAVEGRSQESELFG